MRTPETPARPAASSWLEIDRFVAAFEDCQVRQGHADIRAFLPDPGVAHYLSVLRELVRVDLEYAWERGRGRRAEEYFLAFPELKADPESLREISFEEYRQRRQAGESPSPADYQQRFGVDTRQWPALVPDELGPPSPKSAPRSALGREGGPPAQADALEEAAAVYLKHWRTSSQGDKNDSDIPPAPLPGSAAHAELFLELHHSDPQAAYRLAQALTTLPPEGVKFLDFQLLRELGRGAFSRVYLARQGDLADRPVALKISGDLAGEPQTLARLQHTNIVPVYSVHRVGPFQALCMPFFGPTTLADVLKDLRRSPRIPTSGRWLVERLGGSIGRGDFTQLENMSYVEAVLWTAQRLANGLAHAHERGVLHGDLKPANVLLSDEARPMLLDFNLSQDTRLRSSAPAAHVGGTLPYMAPEQLEAFGAGELGPDARSDLYALGLILYELLTARYPFQLRTGPVSAVLPAMIEDRLGPPPEVRRWNPAVSPAMEAIVRRCLERDPARRYPAASELEIDLERQRTNLPLRYVPEPSWRERAGKWLRRHPRLTSIYSAATVAALVLVGLGTLYNVRWRELQRRGEELAQASAVNALHEFREELKTSRFLLCTAYPGVPELREGLELTQHALNRYRILDDSNWQGVAAFVNLSSGEQERLRGDFSEMLLLRARGLRLTALSQAAPPRREEALRDALRLNRLAEECIPAPMDRRAIGLQRACLLKALGDSVKSRKLQGQAEALPVQTARDLYLAGAAKLAARRYVEAFGLLKKAVRQDPEDAVVWYALGVCHARLGRHDKAAACFDTSIALWPRFYGSYAQRGLAYLELKDYEEARADLTEALRRRPDYSPARVNRALVRAALKDYQGAAREVTTVLETEEPAPTRLYFMRAVFRARAGDAKGAQQDRAEGLRRRPADELSWVTRGLNRMPKDPAGALADFEEALKLNPGSLEALQNKAHVLSERLGRTAEAVRALDRAVACAPDYVPARAGRGVLLARLNRRRAALEDATQVLRRDSRPATLYQVACIYSLTSRHKTGDRQEAFRLLARALGGGYGADLLAVDPDLNPLRSLPEYLRLLDSAQARRGEGRGPIR
jgi:serine/threonine protein kinase/Flp pilus assembly protein TadD